MKYKLVLNFFLVIMAVIIGGGLYKLFDFDNLKFDKPALAVVYAIALIMCIGFMIKKKNK